MSKQCQMNEKGFSVVLGVAVLLIVVLGGLVGVRASQNNRKPTVPSTPSRTAQEQAIEEAKNYRPEGNCTQAEVPAVHEETGARYTFPTGCIAPGWSSTLSIPTSDTPPVPQATNPESTSSIEVFYNGLQTGMSTNEVIKLAGRQPNDCASTGSVPPSVTCFWYDGAKTVTVHYGQTDVVQSKNKSGF